MAAPKWLSGFLSKSQFESFFRSISTVAAEFDVLDLPAALWPNLYLLHVNPDGSLPIRIAGEGLRTVLSRDLRGQDLTDIMHGPSSDSVVRAYRTCVADATSICLRRHVQIRSKGLIKVVEGAIAPLIEGDRVIKVAGCLFLYSLETVKAGALGELYSVNPR